MDYITDLLNKLLVKKQYTYTNKKLSFNLPNLNPDIDYFATFFILLISILIILFITTISWYMAYNKANKIRRCNKVLTPTDRKINVTAYDKDNGYALYSVNYDLAKKKFSSECACESGKTSNNFKFNVMNLSSKVPKVISKTCLCDGTYDKNSIYYKGNSGLIDFMNNKDNTYVFSNPSID